MSSILWIPRLSRYSEQREGANQANCIQFLRRGQTDSGAGIRAHRSRRAKSANEDNRYLRDTLSDGPVEHTVS